MHLHPLRLTTSVRSLPELFANNRAWAADVNRRDPDFFPRLARQQRPEYLWIGCSDSRVPANQIVGLLPGELFVHRNVANVVVHTDLNCLSVLQFAVEVLGVRHVIVCGHYGCGGVGAVLSDRQHGLVDNWLRHVEDVYHRHAAELAEIADHGARVDRLCELNVLAQARNVARTTTVQDAWRAGRELHVHGWIYGIRDGLLTDLGLEIASPDDLARLPEPRRAGLPG
ncbi:MAG TPA: carbonate dehydratase [Gemmatimonadaceae bacterium]|nr:carbonate dehydratase [Gemmatimonadaceae bacterium]